MSILRLLKALKVLVSGTYFVLKSMLPKFWKMSTLCPSLDSNLLIVFVLNIQKIFNFLSILSLNFKKLIFEIILFPGIR